jgi:MYXO-CTERM domain-containing protein
MKLRTLAAVSGLGGSLLVCSTSQGGFAGMLAEQDIYALNGITLLQDLPGYAGQRVFNIYALVENINDQVVGVVGTPSHPFSVSTSDGSGFINSVGASGNDAPSTTEAQFINDINWDSFYTIGKNLEPYSTPLIVAPGTPGPSDTGKWGDGSIGQNMAWTLPPTTPQGAPTPETLAGPSLRVLVMRLSVQGAGGVSGQTEISGQMGLLVFDGPSGVGTEEGGFFTTAPLPAPGAMALLALAGLAGGRRRRNG